MKFVKTAKYAVMGFAILLCEMTFGKYLEISGAVPMLTFCFCVAFASLEKEINYVAFVSAFAGALFDILSGHGFGTYTLLFTLSAVATFLIRDNVFSSKALMLICDVFILSVFVEIIYFLIHITNIRGEFYRSFISVMLPVAVYNSVVSLIFYNILKPILSKRR